MLSTVNQLDRSYRIPFSLSRVTAQRKKEGARLSPAPLVILHLHPAATLPRMAQPWSKAGPWRGGVLCRWHRYCVAFSSSFF